MTLTLHEHPFAAYCWKALIALYERDVPFARQHVGDEADRARLAELWPPASIPVLVDDARRARARRVDDDRRVPRRLRRRAAAGARRRRPPRCRPASGTACWTGRWRRRCRRSSATACARRADATRRAWRRRTRSSTASYALLDRHLAETPWAAGDAFTLADCAAAPALHYARVVHRWDEPGLPHLTRYAEALMARPSVARVIDEARPYREVFPLPWPEWVD